MLQLTRRNLEPDSRVRLRLCFQFGSSSSQIYLPNRHDHVSFITRQTSRHKTQEVSKKTQQYSKSVLTGFVLSIHHSTPCLFIKIPTQSAKRKRAKRKATRDKGQGRTLIDNLWGACRVEITYLQHYNVETPHDVVDYIVQGLSS